MNSNAYPCLKHGHPLVPRKWAAPYLSVLVLSALIFLSACPGGGRAKPLPALEDLNLLLIVMDTVGAEHIGAYGKTPKGRNLTPNIDRLAANGVLFKRAYAAAPWTMPSIASILTGQMPWRHGVTRPRHRLAEDRVTLADMLKSRGYASAAVTSHMLLEEKFGLVQGFDKNWQVNQGLVHQNITSDLVSDTAIKWLREQPQGPKSKFFLMLHYFDPHSPYYAREPWAARYGGASTNHLRFSGMDPAERNEVLAGVKRELGDDTGALAAYMDGMRADLLNLYDSEIAFTDDRIRQLFGTLGIDPEETAILVTADHGEEFFEHGGVIGHGRTLYEPAVRIPMIWSLPGGRRGVRIGTPVSLLDVLPTLLELAGAEPASGVDGLSLVPALREGREPAPRSFILETERHPDSVWVGLVDEQWKYMLRTLAPGRTGSLLVILAQDPGETRDCKAEHTEIAGQMHQSLEAWSGAREARQAQRRSTWLDPKREQELRSLGYLK